MQRIFLKKWKLIFVLFIVSALFLACNSEEKQIDSASCTKLDDCKSDLQCVEGKCKRKLGSSSSLRPLLGKTYGAPACEKAVASGSSGIQTFRLTVINEAFGDEEALDLSLLEKGSLKLTTRNFSLFGQPKVFDASGSPAQNVQVSIEVVNTGSLAFYINPHFKKIKSIIANKRVPKAISLMIDMSETAGSRDSFLSRTSASANWVLEKTNSDRTKGFFDIFSALLLRNGAVTSKDLLFQQFDVENQFLTPDIRKKGFILTNEKAKGSIADTFMNISNANVSGSPPIYEGIQNSATRLSIVSFDKKETIFSPGLIAILTERDMSHLNSKSKKMFNDAKMALQKKWIPFSAIVYPKPEQTTDKQWQDSLKELCSLSQVAGKEKKGAWGQVFQILPNSRNNYYAQVRKALDQASYLLKGSIDLDIKYTLKGAQKGKQYWVSFKLKTQLDGYSEKLDETDAPSIYFKVNN